MLNLMVVRLKTGYIPGCQEGITKLVLCGGDNDVRRSLHFKFEKYKKQAWSGTVGTCKNCSFIAWKWCYFKTWCHMQLWIRVCLWRVMVFWSRWSMGYWSLLSKVRHVRWSRVLNKIWWWLYELFLGGGAGACTGFIYKLGDKNIGVSLGCIVHQIRAKVKIVRFVSHIRFIHPGQFCTSCSRLNRGSPYWTWAFG